MKEMAERQIIKAVAIALIIAGGILVLWVLAMWMMPSMMGNVMGSMSGCMGMCTFGPLLLAAVLGGLGVVFLRKGGVSVKRKKQFFVSENMGPIFFAHCSFR